MAAQNTYAQALDPDAAAYVTTALPELMPQPLYLLGVRAGRELNLLPDAPPPPAIFLTYDLTVPGPWGDIPVRVYQPRQAVHLPVLMYLHGGGWSIGSLAGADAVCRSLANLADCVVVSVDYRQAPEHKFPVPFDDCYAVLRWLYRSATDVGGDAGRIAVGGDSAGGNLAAAVAQAARDNNGPPIVMQLLVYPATEYASDRPSWTECGEAPVLTAADTRWFWNLYLRDHQDRTDPRAVPGTAEDLGGLPPAAVLTAEHDPIRDDGEAYARQLAEAGTPVFQKRYPGAFHGFFTMVGAFDRTTEAIGDAALQLRRAFADPIPAPTGATVPSRHFHQESV